MPRTGSGKSPERARHGQLGGALSIPRLFTRTALTLRESGSDNRPTMELNDDLREMLKELGQAINESISGSGRVHDSIQRIRDEGYNLYMVLDAKVGVNRKEARQTRVRRGGGRDAP